MHPLYCAASRSLVFVLFLFSNGIFAQEPDAPAEVPPEDAVPAEEPPAEEPAVEEPPAEEPPAEEPPAEEPPVEEPPVEEPPVEEPPVEEPPVGEGIAPVEPSPPSEPSPPGASTVPPSLSQPIGVAPPPPTAPAAPIPTAPAAPLAPPVPPPAPAEEPVSADVPTEAPAGEEPAVASTSDEGPKLPAPMSEEADDDKPNGFSKFSFSPQIGYSYYPQSEYEYDGLKLSVDKRNSFVVKMHLDFGGDGLAFELVPMFASEVIGGDLSSVGTDLEGGVSGSFFSVGGQMNVVFRGSWGSFYPHLGIGFQGNYLFADDIEYGAELYGRVPLGFTWYVAKRFGLVAEFAFMFGATGIKRPTPDIDELYANLAVDGVSEENIENIDWTQVSSENPQADIQAELASQGVLVDDEQVNGILEEQISKAVKFGSGFAFELMVGFRFP